MILFISVKDWANVGYMFAESLRTIGIDALSVSLRQTGIVYPETSLYFNSLHEIIPYIEESDIVVLMHSNPDLLTIPYDLRKKKVAVFHGGSEYRIKPEIINALFNDLVYVSIVQTGNLLGLGAKNEKWIIPAIDIDKIPVVPKNNKKLIVGHFPRSFLVKGTDEINKVVNKLKNKYDFEYFYSNIPVTWEESLRRMSRCDIYICAMKPELYGKHYGGGIEITDLESMALGNITITHHTTFDRFEGEFGRCPLFVANNPDQLWDRLDEALSMSRENIKIESNNIRKWVEEHASYEAVGKRLKEILYEN